MAQWGAAAAPPDLAVGAALGDGYDRPVSGPAVSVVVATRGRPEMLRRCVGSILRSDHPSFEVIIADQSPEPADLGSDARVRHLHLTSRGKSAALNEGIAAAAAPLLAFTDDDCTVPERWLRRGAEVFDHHPEVGLIFGDLRPYEHDPTKWLVPGGALARFRIRSGISAVLSRGGPGANCFARSSACRVVGPWDERIGPGTEFESCEEFDFYYRAAAAGVVVARVPALEVVHWGRRPGPMEVRTRCSTGTPMAKVQSSGSTSISATHGPSGTSRRSTRRRRWV